jgi:hypothetical protein
MKSMRRILRKNFSILDYIKNRPINKIDNIKARDPSYVDYTPNHSASWDFTEHDQPLDFDHRLGFDYTAMNIR